MNKSQPLYLRPDIQIEPLMDRWYAWPHLIPPATMARNLTERHLRIFDSYLADPQSHADAVANPSMIGGPFIDYAGGRVQEIQSLRDDTVSRRAGLIRFSKALEELDSLLRLEAKGFSLQPLYERVPVELKGYVELVYDLNNNPSFRLLEALLYRSPYFVREMQSLMLSRTSGDDRPFILSTPRLDLDTSLHLQLPFCSDLVDLISRSKAKPAPVASLCASLAISGCQAELLESFFTDQPPRPYAPYSGSGIRWRYFGHACILVETQGLSILVDPVLSYTYEATISRYTYEDLPDRVDFVLITHNHMDHVLFETLLQIRHKLGAIVVPRSGGGAIQDPSPKLMLQQIGFPNVVELEDLETISLGKLQITGLPFLGEHSDLDIRSKLGYLVRTDKHRLVFAADTCNIDPFLYRHLSRHIQPIDVLFIGMECDGAPLTHLYGPLFSRRVDRASDQSRRLNGSNCAQAIDIVEQFRPKEVYVYAMGQEPWLNHVMSIKYTDQSRPIVESSRFVEECIARGLVAERLFGEKEILM